MGDDSRSLWYLQHIDLFRNLPPDAIAALAQLLVVQHFTAGELVAGPDAPRDRVYVIKEGEVRLFHRAPDGREATVAVLGEGRLFGLSDLFGSGSPGLLAQTMRDSVLCYADGQQFMSALARSPAAIVELTQQLGTQLLEVERQVERFAFTDARTRLASVLLRLTSESGEPTGEGGRRLPAGVTREAIARMIGARRETVARQLSALEAEGYIRRDGRRLTVIDPERFARDFGLGA